MSSGDYWPGSRWWRMDVHAHSPASYDFAPPEDRSAKNWSAWVIAARDAGLDAIAVTDHNTALGIQPIQDAARAIEGAPIIFPGVEITASDGTHLLVLFDPACSKSEVEDFLSRAGVRPGDRGSQEARSSLNVESLLGLECSQGLILGAHVDKDNGLLSNCTGQQRINVLKDRRLAGVEVTRDQEHSDLVSWLN